MGMWIAKLKQTSPVVSEFQFSLVSSERRRVSDLPLDDGGVRNPDRSGSGSGLVAAAFLDLAHEVDQDQVFPRPWSAEPAGEPKLPGGDPGP
ncbi:hypothetical protein BDA96_04G235100 [Sorghum bicolor]|jgi:hypothetical protein|nr:hypothetical protein BDA96_04G235100 [Sorghum bicolor]